ncbi:MAG: class I SAM-dependent methyltransferase [Syntrophomonas sp.]
MISISIVQDLIAQNNPNKYYFVYRQYEEAYWQHIPGWISEFSRDNKIGNILDIGLAYGTIALYARLNTGADVYALDSAQYISDDLLAKYDIHYVTKNIETEDVIYEHKYELIIFTEVFEHLNYYCIPTLLKIKKMLADNGVIMFSTPAQEFWGRTGEYESWKDMPTIDKKIETKDAHIYQYNLKELLEIFKTVGLKIDKFRLSDGFNNMKHFNMQLSKVPTEEITA